MSHKYYKDANNKGNQSLSKHTYHLNIPAKDVLSDKREVLSHKSTKCLKTI